MKKLILMIMIMGISVNMALAGDAIVTGKKLNMREEPNINSKSVRTLKNGYYFKTIDGTEVIKNGEQWIQASDSDGVLGWVRMEYMDYVDNKEISINKKQKSKNNLKRETKEISNNIFNKDEEIETKDDVLKRSTKIESNIVSVSGEGLHRVEISLKDLNRITCNGKISDPIYSKDKEIEIVRGGNKDLFVKISPIKITQAGITEVIYNDFPREVYVECNNMVYNLSLLPKDNLPSQTIVFKSPLADTQKALNYEKSTAYETMISDILKTVYVEQIPEGYAVKKGTLKYQFEEIDMRLRYVYTGHQYIVEDWEITSKLPETMELEENVFVSVLKNPRAISLTVPRLSFGEKGRLLVVRLAANNHMNN